MLSQTKIIIYEQISKLKINFRPQLKSLIETFWAVEGGWGVFAGPANEGDFDRAYIENAYPPRTFLIPPCLSAIVRRPYTMFVLPLFKASLTGVSW